MQQKLSMEWKYLPTACLAKLNLSPIYILSKFLSELYMVLWSWVGTGCATAQYAWIDYFSFICKGKNVGHFGGNAEVTCK